jgi:hypothetical protein
MSPFFLQWKALGPSQTFSPYNKKMKMIVKELLAHPLNVEVNGSMKWCQCVIVKE